MFKGKKVIFFNCLRAIKEYKDINIINNNYFYNVYTLYFIKNIENLP